MRSSEGAVGLGPSPLAKRKNNAYTGDPRTRDAKARGFPARSVFKLEEIDRRLRLFRHGQRILDLGAAPGSWSMYAGQRVGAEGGVFAVDLQELPPTLGANVRTLTTDALGVALHELGEPASYDVVLSDMAPSTSGSKARDQALSYELFSRALSVAATLGRPGSHFLAKLFMGPDFQSARLAVRNQYAECRVLRPAGTRQQSSEVFIAGLGLKGAGG